MLLKNDEINNLHREYFDVMDISEEQKLERIELAELLDDVFLFLFVTADAFPDLDINEFKEMGNRRYLDSLEEYGISFEKYPDVKTYAERMLNNIIDSTFRQKDRENKPNGNSSSNNVNNSIVRGGDNDTSSYIREIDKLVERTEGESKKRTQEQIQQRAIGVAQNESNSIFNRMEYDDAVYSGFATKTWITEGDNKVRETHVEVDFETIPIDQPFYVGGSQMMFPKDDSMGATADEIANCRCTTVYS